MKKEILITHIEIEKWLKENKEIILNAIIKKIKQKENIFYFKLFRGKTYHLIVYLPYFLFISDFSIRIEKPTNFQLILRKYVENQKITNVFQREFDKIIVFELSNKIKLVFEFFSDGNIIILNPEGKIIDALVKREWKDRNIGRDLCYEFPPTKNLLKKSFLEIFEILRKESKPIFKFLSENFGLNFFYSREILKNININENKNCNEISYRELDLILKEIEEIKNTNEFYVFENEILWIGSLKLDNSTNFKRINEAFSYSYNILERKKAIKIKEKEQEKIKKILDSIEKNKKELEEELNRVSLLIDLVQKNFHTISEISNKILELRKLNVEWEEIKQIIKKQYPNVINIDEHKALFKLKFDSFEADINFKNFKEFLNTLFVKRKKIKEKLENLKQKNFSDLKIKLESTQQITKDEKKEEKKWYEKFRWFISSDGFLVVSGKDARTNEELIRKYTRDYDLVLHADIHGSPFTVIRNDKKQSIPPQTIYEAAQFTACYSQAWDLGLGTIPVYYVKKDQLVKANLPKGSFMIRGEKIQIEKVKLRISIGIIRENEKLNIFSAPPVATRKITQYIVTLVPGDRSSDVLVKEIRKHFENILPFEYRSLFEKISDDEIKRLIPFGKGELVRVL